MEGTFCSYKDSQAEVLIQDSRYLCPLYLFLENNLPHTARDLLPGCPLSISLWAGNIRAIHIIARQSADSVATDQFASLRITQSLRSQEDSHANAAAMGIITTPEAMKLAFGQSFREKIFSYRVFPIWILSDLMGASKDTINNLEEVERSFEGFRRMNTAENAFFLAVSVALVQGLLLRSTPVQTRQDYFRCLNQPSLNEFTGSGPFASLSTLSALREDKALWSNITTLIESNVIPYRDKEYGGFLSPEDVNSKEVSEILIRSTAEVLGVSLTVYSPRDSYSKVACEESSASLRIALIKDAGFYYPLLTRQELIEEWYDVYTCSFIENPAHNRSV